MLTVGLTGSIAVGKSYVCSVLREAGVLVLDADLTARDVVANGTSGLKEIIDQFGQEILDSGGHLDRKKLASIVFGDSAKLRILNSIVHPRVFIAQNDWLREIAAGGLHSMAVVDAALMIESGGYKRFDKIIVVWCEPIIQLRRLMLRDDLDKAEAEKRIAAQMTQDRKKSFADFLIDTSHGFVDTSRQTIGVLEKLRVQAVEMNVS
ncbi:MAG: dephospho-CoA kinase [Acidobacteriota bacterium]